MRLLVLHRLGRGKPRKTILDHLYALKRYGEGVEVHYIDCFLKLPSFIYAFQWDGIILHYTLLAERFNPPLWKHLAKRLAPLKKIQALKIAIPQDEYAHTQDLWDLFKKIGVETVFTCGEPSEYDKLYPLERSGLKHRITTLTGFVDEETLDEIETLKQEGIEREIDIGYRARKLPYWVGRHGQLKWEVGEFFASKLASSSIKTDISSDDKDVFLGKDWIRFLLKCKSMIGCLGGSSLLDPDGSIRKKVEGYVARYPQASFDEVEKVCFPGEDGRLALYALSPRHFECAMTKTCQVLVEGNYQGVFEKDRHYIPLKKDFSNFEEVLEKLQNPSLCHEIAERAFQEVVLSGNFTYRRFAREILNHIRQNAPICPKKGSWVLKQLVKFHQKIEPLRRFCFKVWYKLAIHWALRR